VQGLAGARPLSTSLLVIGIFFALSGDAEQTVQALPILQFNLILLSILTLVMGRQLWTILFSSKSRGSAPLLHRRFVLVFSLAALTPAILVGTFSTTLISRNINDVLGGSNSSVMQAR